MASFTLLDALFKARRLRGVYNFVSLYCFLLLQLVSCNCQLSLALSLGLILRHHSAFRGSYGR